MQGVHLRKYGVQTTIDFEVYEVDGVDLRVDWTPAAADCEVMKDEGASTQCSNTATDEGSTYSIVLTATEMQAARLVLKVVDAATKVFLDKVIGIETYGNASAMHAFDLDTAAQVVASVTGAVGSVAGNVAGNVDGNVDGSVAGSVASVTADVTTDAASRTASKADVSSLALASVCTEGRLAELDAGNLPTDIAAIPTTAMRGTDSGALASVCTEGRLAELDAGNLPTDVAAIPTTAMRGTDSAALAANYDATRAGYLDNLSAGAVALEASLTAMKGAGWSTETLTTIEAAIVALNDLSAAAVWDLANGIETGYTPRQTMRIIAAAVGGKLSGAATATNTIRSIIDGKDRITATVDSDGNRSAVTLDGT